MDSERSFDMRKMIRTVMLAGMLVCMSSTAYASEMDMENNTASVSLLDSTEASSEYMGNSHSADMMYGDNYTTEAGDEAGVVPVATRMADASTDGVSADGSIEEIVLVDEHNSQAVAYGGSSEQVNLGESLGNFKLTAYCGCRKCNGRWTGYPTASGTDYVQGRTIAVDKRVIPLGTWVYINIPNEGWQKFRAEDTGGAIKKNRIDVYVDGHNLCNQSKYNGISEVRLAR